MDDSHIPIVAVATAVGVVLGKLFDGGVSVINAWYSNRGQAKAAQFTEQGQIIDRQEKQIARLEAQIREQQEAIEKLRDEDLDCREEQGELRSILTLFHEDMTRAGLKPRDIPPPRKRGVNPDFLTRQTGQTNKLLTSVDERLKQEPPAGGGHADSHN